LLEIHFEGYSEIIKRIDAIQMQESRESDGNYEEKL